MTLVTENDQSTSTINCNLCGGRVVSILSDTDRDNRPLQTVICRACGLVWTDPRPDAGSNRKFYSEEYRRRYKATYHPKLKHVYRDMLRAIQRYKRISPLLTGDMKILDIGAGAGFFPYMIKKQGFEVKGLEPNNGYAEYARQEFGLDVVTGFLEDVDFGTGEYDVITLNHVLEHLQDPHAALVRLSSWLKSGGYLNVEVPNIEATFHAPQNRFHLAHLYTFNPANLCALGEKAGYIVHDMQVVAGTMHINVLFRKPPATAHGRAVPGGIPGNFEHIRAVYDSHTVFSHYLSVKPYTRLARKLAAYMREFIEVSRYRCGRDVADDLITRAGV